MLISVFLFSREVGREALATNPYTDVPFRSQSNENDDHYLSFFISFAQTL